jgi:hypothetical protein
MMMRRIVLVVSLFNTRTGLFAPRRECVPIIKARTKSCVCIACAYVCVCVRVCVHAHNEGQNKDLHQSM